MANPSKNASWERGRLVRIGEQDTNSGRTARCTLAGTQRAIARAISLSGGENRDRRTVFCESWLNDPARRWNDLIGEQFYNGQGGHFNGDHEGLQQAIAQARESLNQEDFARLAQHLQDGTGGNIQATQTAQGLELSHQGRRFLPYGSMVMIDQHTTTEIRRTIAGTYMVRGSDGIEREFVPSDQTTLPPAIHSGALKVGGSNQTRAP